MELAALADIIWYLYQDQTLLFVPMMWYRGTDIVNTLSQCVSVYVGVGVGVYVSTMK